MKNTEENQNIKHISTSANMFNTVSLNSLYNLKLDFIEPQELEEKLEEKLEESIDSKKEYNIVLESIIPILAFFQNLANNIKSGVKSFSNDKLKQRYLSFDDECDIYKFEFNERQNIARKEKQINFFDKTPLNNINTIENKELGKYISKLLKSSLEDDTFYTVDRIEDSIVVLENRNNLKMVNIDKNNIPFDICERDILYYSKGIFEKDTLQKKTIEQTLKEKMDNLWE